MLQIGRFALVVREYEEAISFYTEKLGFVLREDTDLGNAKRWVRIAPSAEALTEILLARAVNEEQASRIGNQAGGRVFLFFETDDFWRDFEAFTSRGVRVERQPVEEPYGTVAVLLDLYGNKFDLIQPRA
jgi:catechol 2,3-dioxygenase-like lactoylglutathione lyase family enzyme